LGPDWGVDLEEEGTRIALTVVDTPGFGDQIDNEACFAEVAGYLERQYDDILAEESRIKRNPRFRDNRVHALLYFITPTGHGYPTPPSHPSIAPSSFHPVLSFSRELIASWAVFAKSTSS
jgi:hypothetical protein